MTFVLLYFFSATGNTWWVAKTLAEKLKELDIETQLVNIESKKEELTKKPDMIGIAYPVYGSDYPVNVGEFVEGLPDAGDMDCFIVTSMLGFSGDGALTLEKTLKDKGYNLKQAVNFRMMNNIKLPYPVLAQTQMYSEKEAAIIRENTGKKIKRLAERIASEEKWIEGRGILNNIGGLMQRVPVGYLGWTRWAHNFSLDKDACTSCGQCVKYCPTQNITMKDGDITWGENCMCCVRCYNLCPTDAILYKEGSRNRKKFPRFKGPVPGFKLTDMEW